MNSTLTTKDAKARLEELTKKVFIILCRIIISICMGSCIIIFLLKMGLRLRSSQRKDSEVFFLIFPILFKKYLKCIKKILIDVITLSSFCQ